jgi:hypothetical protein
MPGMMPEIDALEDGAVGGDGGNTGGAEGGDEGGNNTTMGGEGGGEEEGDGGGDGGGDRGWGFVVKRVNRGGVACSEAGWMEGSFGETVLPNNALVDVRVI